MVCANLHPLLFSCKILTFCERRTRIAIQVSWQEEIKKYTTCKIQIKYASCVHRDRLSMQRKQEGEGWGVMSFYFTYWIWEKDINFVCSFAHKLNTPSITYIKSPCIISLYIKYSMCYIYIYWILHALYLYTLNSPCVTSIHIKYSIHYISIY